MKCLTVQQPWAWAIVAGRKRVENRTWRTDYRGPLLIHAGRSRRSLCDRLPDGSAVDAGALHFGAVLGVVDLTDCRPREDLFDDLGDDPFAAGPWCWVLGGSRPLLRPLPLAGQLGLFEVPDEWILPLLPSTCGSPTSRQRR